MKLIAILAVSFIATNCHVTPDERPSSAVIHHSNYISNGNAVRTAQERGTLKVSGMVQTECQPANTCYGEPDCPRGRCLGLAVGKCNCGACVTFARCTSDQQCGGLQGACRDKHYCDCDKGFKAAGYESSLDALVKMCNVKECIPDTPSCHGLPCNAGFCVCPI